VDKLLSIAAHLAIYSLPSGSNPVKQISACLSHKTYIAVDDPSLETFHGTPLDAQDLHLLLGFSTTLIEQMSKVKLSQQARYILLCFTTDLRMKSVRPLREGSDDLANIFNDILHRDPWDTAIVQKALYCYRAWVEYAVHEEEVTMEILFP
jgi:hypothetical protein